MVPVTYRLGLFYFVFFGAVGAMTPFWTLFLRERGLDADAIGAVVALMTITKVIAPNFWGWLADVKVGRLATIRFGAAMSALVFAGMFVPGGFWWLALVAGLYGFFQQGVLPQFEALTLTHLQSETSRYARIRIWGSIGFIVTVVGVGALLDRLGPGWLPAMVVPLLAVTAVVCFSVGTPGRAANAEGAAVLKSDELPVKSIAAFLVASLLMAMSHGPFYVFFSIHLANLGYSGALTGQLWALGVVAEIGAFYVMAQLVHRFGLRRLFLLCFFLGAVRWVLVAEFAHQLMVLAFSQVLHAATFGIFHASAVQLVHRYFPEPYRGRGQGLYSGLGFGLGGGLGSLGSGLLWHHAGAYTTWVSAALVSALGLVVAWVWVRPTEATESR